MPLLSLSHKTFSFSLLSKASSAISSTNSEKPTFSIWQPANARESIIPFSSMTSLNPAPSKACGAIFLTKPALYFFRFLQPANANIPISFKVDSALTFVTLLCQNAYGPISVTSFGRSTSLFEPRYACNTPLRIRNSPAPGAAAQSTVFSSAVFFPVSVSEASCLTISSGISGSSEYCEYRSRSIGLSCI